MGMFENPYAGLVVFVALPAVVRARSAADPGRACGCSAGSCGAHPDADRDWPVLDFRQAAGPPHGPGHRRAHRRQPRHPAARRLRHAALDGVAGLLRPDVPHADAPAVHRLAGGAALARRLRRLPHRRRRPRRSCTTSWSACGSSYHVVTGQIPQARSRVCADLRPAARDLRHLSPADRGFRRSHPRHSRVRRRRNELPKRRRSCRCTSAAPGQPTAAGRAIHWHADPASTSSYIATDPDRQTIPYVKVTDAQGKVREYVTEGTTPEQLAQGEHAQDGLRRLPQRRRSPDFAGRGAGRRRRHRRRHGSAATLPFVRREGVRLLKAAYPDQDAGVRRDRRGPAGVLRVARQRRRRPQPRPAVDGLRTVVPPQRVPDDEGHVGRLPRQPRPHDVDRLLPLPRRQPHGQGRDAPSAPTASTATSRSRRRRRPRTRLLPRVPRRAAAPTTDRLAAARSRPDYADALHAPTMTLAHA